ncbi:hypothetical protein P7K49_009004 [Saguinus oedipus]|uniref:Uncharacterized protein n=1 Tax=Saguinus oedipus TaxID=9490 RepID=A0ABQ9VZB0_SAGOE|nr:hypothetical protein P7K49_009004 [Saguinus oedipus]
MLSAAQMLKEELMGVCRVSEHMCQQGRPRRQGEVSEKSLPVLKVLCSACSSSSPSKADPWHQPLVSQQSPVSVSPGTATPHAPPRAQNHIPRFGPTGRKARPEPGVTCTGTQSALGPGARSRVRTLGESWHLKASAPNRDAWGLRAPTLTAQALTSQDHRAPTVRATGWAEPGLTSMALKGHVQVGPACHPGPPVASPGIASPGPGPVSTWHPDTGAQDNVSGFASWPVTREVSVRWQP